MFVEDLSYFIGLECQLTTNENQVFTGIVGIEDGKVLIKKNETKPAIVLDPINVYQIRNLKS